DGLSADGKRVPGPWLFVKIDVKTPDDAVSAAKFMLTHKMVSKQTGPDGIEVDKILVAASVDIDKEYYLSVTLDRNIGTPIIIASAAGGGDIEEIAEKHPDKIIREPLHPHLGLLPFAALKVARKIGFTGKQASIVAKIMVNLSKFY